MLDNDLRTTTFPGTVRLTLTPPAIAQRSGRAGERAKGANKNSLSLAFLVPCAVRWLVNRQKTSYFEKVVGVGALLHHYSIQILLWLGEPHLQAFERTNENG